jgi:DNA-binding MarR family transcriptional regulator
LYIHLNTEDAMNEAAQRVCETIARDCLATRIRSLNRAITSVYDSHLRPYGLTTPQLNILVVIRRLGAVSPKRIGDLLVMEKSTVSRNLARMRARGWLLVGPGRTGERQRVSLTGAGETLLVEAAKGWSTAQAATVRFLGPQGVATLNHLTTQIA